MHGAPVVPAASSSLKTPVLAFRAEYLHRCRLHSAHSCRTSPSMVASGPGTQMGQFDRVCHMRFAPALLCSRAPASPYK